MSSYCRDVFLVVETLVLPFLYVYFFRLLFGTLYPAYASYKAVRTKNVKEYVSPRSLSSSYVIDTLSRMVTVCLVIQVC